MPPDPSDQLNLPGVPPARLITTHIAARRKARASVKEWRKKNPTKYRAQKNRAGARRILQRRAMIEAERVKGCQRCGEMDPVVLDFHHIRGPKSFTIANAQASVDIGMETLRRELKKCDVLCANCHRRAHHTQKAAA